MNHFKLFSIVSLLSAALPVAVVESSDTESAADAPVVTEPAIGGATVIFEDDFDTEASYHAELTKNATSKVYVDNSLPEGHLLKKWRYNWKYDYFEGDWKQAFYVVAPGESVMVQAGRSGAYYAMSPYRITAKAEIPVETKRYRIELKQFKNDNDPLLYFLGCDKLGQEGVQLGYENQRPGTDHTVQDAYLRGDICPGLILEGRAYHRQWVDVVIDVNVEKKYVTWTVDDEPMLTAYVPMLTPGGYFGIGMHYERGTKFDDVKITVLE